VAGSYSRRALLLATGTAVFCAGRACFVATRAVPRIRIDPPALDLGTVAAGQPARCAFSIRNGGDGTLLIRDVRAGCVCTVPAVSSYRIPPGATASVVADVTYKTIGRRHAAVVVRCNDPGHPLVAVPVHATVVPAPPAMRESGEEPGGL
jgi:hypothetical protein